MKTEHHKKTTYWGCLFSILILILIIAGSCGTSRTISYKPYHTTDTWYCGKTTTMKHKHPSRKIWMVNSKKLKHKKFK